MWGEPGDLSQTFWLLSNKTYKLENGASFLRLGVNSHENEALFPQLGLPSTLIRHENGAFQKYSSNLRNLKTPACPFRVDVKHYENRAFRKRKRHDNHLISCPTNGSERWLRAFSIDFFSVVWAEKCDGGGVDKWLGR